MSGHDAAIAAMRVLFAPIVGITLVLMAVFLPASFLSGLTGRIYAQFALVIAATALISAINAATLKPTQCALWLRPAVPPEERNVFYRGFNSVYARAEDGYARLIAAMTRRSGLMVVVALVVIAAGGLRPVAHSDELHPDRRPGLHDRRGPASRRRRAQPDGSGSPEGLRSRAIVAERRQGRHHRRRFRARQQRQPRQCGRRLRRAQGLERARQERRPAGRLRQPEQEALGDRGREASSSCRRRRSRASATPPASRFRWNCGMAASISPSCRPRPTLWCAPPARRPPIQRISAPFRASVPQYRVEIDREKIQTLGLNTDQVFSTLAAYIGSSYVGQFNKFGRVFQIYAQADSGLPARSERHPHAQACATRTATWCRSAR